MTRLTLAHVILGHVVRDGLPQVGCPVAGARHVHWNQHVDGLRLSETREYV